MKTKIITGIVKLAYVHIFESYAIEGVEGYEPRYSTTVIISKYDIETLKAINAAIDHAKTNVVRDVQLLKTPLRDGDLERSDGPLYKGCYFLNANSKNKPGVVDANVKPILDSIEVTNGCYARLTLNFYAYNVNGNKGVAAGLENVQYIGGAM